MKTCNSLVKVIGVNWMYSVRTVSRMNSKVVFAPKTTTRTRPWITDETLEALPVARIAEAQQDHNAKRLRHKTKISACKDRIKWVHARLLDQRGDETTGL